MSQFTPESVTQLDRCFNIINDAKVPLHADEIAKRSQNQYSLPHAKDASAVIRSRLNVDIDTYKNRSRFIKTKPAIYGIRRHSHLYFSWTKYYSEFADKLLRHKDNRTNLITYINNSEEFPNFTDKYSDETSGPLQDISPFTVFGMFNKGRLKKENRIKIAKKLGEFLNVSENIPNTFIAIPTVHYQKTWFFDYAKKRKSDDIKRLWNLHETAINYADNNTTDHRHAFIEAFNLAIEVSQAKWNLTMALFWIRPQQFLPLDKNSCKYIKEVLNIKIKTHTLKTSSTKMILANDYVQLIDTLEKKFKEENFPVQSFYELSLAAWNNPKKDDPESEEEIFQIKAEQLPITNPVEYEPYSVDSIMTDGCFTNIDELEKMLERLKSKKNIILQGPPGTGKTWLAKRLAYALLKSKNKNNITAIQFHPNLSYEDFVRGWRPNSEGSLEMINGPFLEKINVAIKDKNQNYICVIEEINRGNPAQIFGEMLTLLEADKRHEDEALSLSYSKNQEESVYIPENLYIIGTMNIADRSIALVDLALRRRFAFIDLEPKFNKKWKNWMNKNYQVEANLLDTIATSMSELNDDIANDANLGPQFKIGHSYFTPSRSAIFTNITEWFKDVIETEIVPLLREYWYDEPEKLKEQKDKLLNNL